MPDARQALKQQLRNDARALRNNTYMLCPRSEVSQFPRGNCKVYSPKLQWQCSYDPDLNATYLATHL